MLERGIGFVDAAIFQCCGIQVALLDLVLGQQKLPAQAGLLKQKQCRAGAQVGLGEPAATLLRIEGQPVLNQSLLDRQLFSQHLEHRLVAVAVRIEAVAQA